MNKSNNLQCIKNKIIKIGNRAKNIKNTPIKNEEKSAKELMILLELSEKKVKQQELIIQNLQNQVFDDNNNEKEKINLYEGEKPLLIQEKKAISIKINNEEINENEIKNELKIDYLPEKIKSPNSLNLINQLSQFKDDLEKAEIIKNELEIELKSKKEEIEEVLNKINKIIQ